ncbi:hypothetical protein H6P81_015967 [Aristolochia fimbriata]|uniref:Uncharacterized protein n=1 Tax=Aristolochia fimbriata TaxID=158543 RepID=A0AAV7EAS2_ARIFI|nr:hypothetical protein H6P81_015967 [Aristolochia fimbriata]
MRDAFSSRCRHEGSVCLGSLGVHEDLFCLLSLSRKCLRFPWHAVASAPLASGASRACRLGGRPPPPPLLLAPRTTGTWDDSSLAQESRRLLGTDRGGHGRGGIKPVRHGAEFSGSRAARPLCHLQYPAADLSRPQRIQIAGLELCQGMPPPTSPPLGAATTRALGSRKAPNVGRQAGGLRCAAPAKLPPPDNVFALIGSGRGEAFEPKRRGNAPPTNGIILSRLFDARKAPKGAASSPSPPPASLTTRLAGSSSSSPPTADGFDWDPVPSPRANPFPRPPPTLSGLPNAVANRHAPFRNFNPIPFEVQGGCTLILRASPVLGSTNPCASAAHMEPFPSSPSKFSFEYLLLPPRSQTDGPPARPGLKAEVFMAAARLLLIEAWLLPPTAGMGRLSRPSIFGLVDSAGMLTLEPFSEDLGRSTVQPARGSRQSASFALFTGLVADSRTHVRLLGPWFQDGSNGEPAGRRQERAGATRARPGGGQGHPPRSQRRRSAGGIIRLALSPRGPQPKATGSGHNGLSPSLAPHSMGLAPVRPSAEDASADYNRTGEKPPILIRALFPFAAATRGILLVFPPDLGSHPSKASGHGGNRRQGSLSEPGPLDTHSSHAGPGRAEPPLSGRRPWGKVFFSQPRRGGKDHHLLADDDTADRPRWGSRARVGRTRRADAQSQDIRCPSRLGYRGFGRTPDAGDRFLSSLGTDRRKWLFVVFKAPTVRWSPTPEPAGRRSLTPGEGIRRRCDSHTRRRWASWCSSLALVAPLRGIDNDPSAGSVDFSQRYRAANRQRRPAIPTLHRPFNR